jgi:hypothetical protein
MEAAMAPPVPGKSTATKRPGAAKQPDAKPPLRNVVPDSVDFRDRPYRPAVAFAPKSRLPAPPATHRPRLNQHDTSACTGFALATVVHVLTSRRDAAAADPVSPFMLYGMARRYDDLAGEAPDGGSSLRGALKGWFKHGVCRQSLWPKLDEPGPSANADWWDDGVRRPLGAYYRVDARSVVDMQVALNETGVLLASALAHDGWYDGYTRKGGKKSARNGIWTIPYPWKAGPDDGHAFALVGYDEDGFIVQNSWGDGWGTHGLAILTYEDWIKHGYDCWVAQLGVVTRQHEAQAAGHGRLSGAISGARFGASGSSLLDLHALSPYVVNTGHNGELSPSGEFHTTYQDLEELANHLLPARRTEWNIAPGAPIDVAIYVHGGLVDEQGAGESAQEWVKLFTDARVFPIYFIWESDLLSILNDRVQNELKNRGDVPTGGLISTLDDAWSDRVEGIVRVVGRSVWQDMKDKGRLITYNTAGRGGGMQLMELLAPQKDTIRLHLVGHSAGAIVHAYLADWLVTQGWSIASASFIAPAATVDLFGSRLQSHLVSGKIGRYAQFHLQDALERSEGGAMRLLLGYRRSLLYLISNALEEEAHVPVLGMEKFFDKEVVPLKLPHVEYRVAPASLATGGTTHGTIDDDSRTQASVLAHIQGKPIPAP